jgi:ATP-dependent Clp protease ATP-binding subunit ClpX
LRGIMEELLTELMFIIPDDDQINEVIIDKDFVEGKRESILMRQHEEKKAA